MTTGGDPTAAASTACPGPTARPRPLPRKRIERPVIPPDPLDGLMSDEAVEKKERAARGAAAYEKRAGKWAAGQARQYGGCGSYHEREEQYQRGAHG